MDVVIKRRALRITTASVQIAAVVFKVSGLIQTPHHSLCCTSATAVTCDRSLTPQSSRCCVCFPQLNIDLHNPISFFKYILFDSHNRSSVSHAADPRVNPSVVRTLSAASPHFSIAARPWLWMWVSRSFFSSPRPSVIRDTRLYIRPRSEATRDNRVTLLHNKR